MKFLPIRYRTNRLILTGYLFLALAGVFRYLVSHQIVPETNLTDAFQGLLYGICIASLLLGVRRLGSRCSEAPPDTSTPA